LYSSLKWQSVFWVIAIQASWVAVFSQEGVAGGRGLQVNEGRGKVEVKKVKKEEWLDGKWEGR
jgi:hypothetical protein